MIIRVGKKFTAADLENIIKVYWEATKANSNRDKIVFDLKEIEWIALEELTFLFGWFRYLFYLGKNLFIELPAIEKPPTRRTRRLISLFHRWKIDSFVPINAMSKYLDTEKYFNLDFDIRKLIFQEITKDENKQYLDDKYWHKIIPFYAIDADYEETANLRDVVTSKLQDIFELEEQIGQLLNSETAASPFENKTLSHIITTELFLNVVHHSFGKDFTGPKQCYMAIVLSNKREPEIYRTNKLREGVDISLEAAGEAVQDIVNTSYANEKPAEERNFFISKAFSTTATIFSVKEFRYPLAPSKLCRALKSDGYLLSSRHSDNDINWLNKLLEFTAFYDKVKVSRPNFIFSLGIKDLARKTDNCRRKSFLTLKPEEQTNIRVLNRLMIEELYPYDSPHVYRNESFIEYTFLDFGNGIPNTLRRQYKDEINNESIREQLSKEHEKINDDSKVLEYAFLLHTSRHPFDKNIEIQCYVPRGLYFLIDIVRRYAGMIVARSNKGKVVFDFSDNSLEIKDCVRFATNDNKLPFFQGTMLSIVLPATKQGIRLNAVQHKIPHITSTEQAVFEYIAISNLLLDTQKNSYDQTTKTHTYNLLFNRLNEQINAANKKSAILVIDFAGCDNNVVDQKLYYYLCNTPNINEKTRAIILNPHDIHVLRNVQQSILSSDVFLFRPIPCACLATNEIIWIGIKNLEDEHKLNELWQYQGAKYAVSDFEDPESLRGNVIKIDWVDSKETTGNISVSIPSFDAVTKYYAIHSIPQKYVMDLIADPDEGIRLHSENDVFWTSSGYYQNEFISFIEKLYHSDNIGQGLQNEDDYFGRKVAKYLFNRLIENDPLPDIHKIVAVTLSSQLLARYIRDAYSEMKGITKEREKPHIIRLANYYDFTSEKPFQKIQHGENILIVHDVIATGTLNKRIYDSLTKDPMRKANIIAMFALVDTRNCESRSQDTKQQLAIDEVCDGEIECRIVCLAKYPVEKFRQNPKVNANIVAINPVLNAPSNTGLVKSDTFKLVYADTPKHIKDHRGTEDFINRIENTFLWVGHLHHHASHHSYFIKTAELFESQPGKELLNDLFSSVRDKEKALGSVESYNAISRVNNQIDQIKRELQTNDKFVRDTLDNIRAKLVALESKLQQPNIFSDPIDVDYVFYPIYSGAESITKGEFAAFLDLKRDNFVIFPLPRIDTPNGWRFTFPPTVLDQPIELKHSKVLMVDDGSCTGETLVQMIDSICFLKVSKIVVLSVIVRLQDFQREFFSRIRKIKVDYTRVDEEGSKLITVVPLDIFFGCHLHIPTFPPTRTCPFCKEIDDLNDIIKLSDPPHSVLNYVKRRIDELQLFETNGSVYDPDAKNPAKDAFTYDGKPFYLPKDIDVRKMYLIRDKLGKLETYRLFTEYLKEFENYKLTDEAFEIFVAVFLHEPELYKIISQFLPGLKSKLKRYISGVIYNNKHTSILLRWKKADLLRFHYIMNKEDFREANKLIKLFEFGETDQSRDLQNRTLDYMSYVLWHDFMNIGQDRQAQIDLEHLISIVWPQFEKSDKYSATVLKEIIVSYNSKKQNTIYSAFCDILYFFIKTRTKRDHSITDLDLIDLISELNLDRFDFAHFETSFKNVISDIRDILKNNIDTFNQGNFLKIYFTDLYNTFFEHDNSVIKVLSVINQDYEFLRQSLELKCSVEDAKARLQASLKTLRNDFISPESKFARFFTKNYKVDIAEVWKRAKESKADMMKKRNIRFFDEDVFLFKKHSPFIFEDCLKRLFVELVTNACKHNDNIDCVCKLREDNFNIIFSIQQSGQIKNSDNHMGGLHMIAETAERFGGSFNVYNDKENPEFVLKLQAMAK